MRAKLIGEYVVNIDIPDKFEDLKKKRPNLLVSKNAK